MSETDSAARSASRNSPNARWSGGVAILVTAIAVVAASGLAVWWFGTEPARTDRRQATGDARLQVDRAKCCGDDTAASHVAESPEKPVTDMDDGFLRARRAMVEYQFRRRDITDERVMEAMGNVPRELFVPEHQRD
ncbi:MAG: hypothetical protein JJ992_25375, partial [Planctomycetes bacterium]|nr:hypothetical protein [Planctomycetota bacterium]